MRDCLDGFRVLDLSQYLPGPYAAQILADLGADVVKIEPPRGDPMRRMGPADSDGVSLFYKAINAGKRVLRLDLKSDSGSRTFASLLQQSDVLVESYRPGALERLGFGPDRVRDLNPRLVHCALSGYGQTGPYRERSGHDINYMAHGGGLAGSGTADRPVAAYPPVADFASGLQAALLTVAALLKRERDAESGAGQHLDVSLAETVLAWQAIPLTAALYEGHRPVRGEVMLNGGAACYQVYRTADDRFLSLGALEAKFWENFCRAVGHEEWIERQWEPLPQHGLIAEVAGMIQERVLADWNELLSPVDCCYQAVLTPEEVLTDPQIEARKLLLKAGTPARSVEVLLPVWRDGQPPAARAPLTETNTQTVLEAWRAG